ncbi:hypothetical protein F8M41_012528 [Gigaspora margarita]|uniref:Uncharacterized protein n=1 Tax=Gigaspora margarita TaxID=4874 RepID=A0A8H4EPD8_GIGMA|nr:hypothetical protein F8M41_012528 [Gigaspora margarita]
MIQNFGDPSVKFVGEVEFWTNAPNTEKDRNTLKNLYEDGFLNILSSTSSDKADGSLQALDKTFWDCFRNSYDVNSRGIDGKVRILSIITENFIYQKLIDELKVR